MSDGESKYPEWHGQFEEAVAEFDPEKLIEKIQKFETAVFVRLQELASSSDHHAERQAIAVAASVMRLKKSRLSDHPDWK